MSSRCLVVCAIIAAVLLGLPARAAETPFTMRARVTAMQPEVPVRIEWRHGGEGLSGNPVRGELTAVLPEKPGAPKGKAAPLAGGDDDDLLPEDLRGGPKAPADRVIVKDKKFDYHYLKLNAWSPEVPVASLKNGRFITFTLTPLETGSGSKKQPVELRQVELEFEFSYGGKVLKTFREKGTDGPTVGIHLPSHLLTKGGKTPDAPEYVSALGGLSHYVDQRLEALHGQPWGNRPLPKRYLVITDCDGHQTGRGFGVRNTNWETFLKEMQVLRALGVNSLRGCPERFRAMIERREGAGAEFAAYFEKHQGQGWPVPVTVRDKITGRIKDTPEGAGCPYFPGLREKLPERGREIVKRLLSLPYPEVWALTVDEIGTVFNVAPEGKGHAAICPHCIAGFREMIRENGLGPADFGAADWEPIRPNVYAPKGEEKQGKAKDGFELENQGDDDLGDAPGAAATKAPAAGALAAPGTFAAGRAVQWLPEPGWSHLQYWTQRFNTHASGLMFQDLRLAVEAANAEKAAALKRGETAAPAAGQPWLQSFALRRNSFLLSGGGGLDFFNFYRTADSAMVYETSNRDPRVWCWDSYLCDVGRVLHEKLGRGFGIYIKPHRGAPIQRLLAFVARGNGSIFWYTYGPDYKKGDSFSQDPDCLRDVSRGMRLVAAAEDLLFGAVPAEPPRVAVVRPAAAEYFGGNADYENGKWVYLALRHAGLPVDPLDEEMLAKDDLSGYRAMVISGNNLPRRAAAKVAAWVEAGGTLYVNGLGCPRDEANQPLTALLPVLGLRERRPAETWCQVKAYGSTALNSLAERGTVPETARIQGRDPAWPADFTPVVAREPLQPAEGTAVLAAFADGAAALTRNSFGKGVAYCAGFYAGLEYSEKIQRPDAEYDMTKDFDPALRHLIAGPVLTAVAPPVTVSEATVEAIHVRNPESGKQGIVLINWAYAGRRNLVVAKDLEVRLARAGSFTKARSAWTGELLPVTRQGDGLLIRVASLDEGDVLFLE